MRVACFRLVLLATLSIMGCAKPHATEPPPKPTVEILMLPGIEGRAWQLGGVIAGLKDAGLTAQMDVVEWGDGAFRSLRNLTGIEANRRHADSIAARIVDQRRARPDESIIVMGYSGGGAMAVLVAEALPPELKIDQLILMGAAISPDYDLTPAMSHTRCGLVNFYSAADWFVLGLGTRLLGTVDRRYCKSAGQCGFVDPADSPSRLEGLTQIPWRTDWIRLGHYGGHVGWLARPWSRDVLAPVIRRESPSGCRPI